MATNGHSLLPVTVQGKTSETDLKNVNTRCLLRNNSMARGVRNLGPTVPLHRQACKPHWICFDSKLLHKRDVAFTLFFFFFFSSVSVLGMS
jgi:hypothetical protein